MQVPVAALFEANASEEDVLRARLYRVLEYLLAVAPDAATLEMLSRLEGECETALGKAMAALRDSALATSPQTAAAEYDILFTGLTERELRPYASWYLTGFLYTQPLGRLRAAVRRLGVMGADGVCEPEDHIASLCAVMAGLIHGRFGESADLALRRSFFFAHLQPWAGGFFDDLARADAAPFYQAVGQVGCALMRVEEQVLA